MNSSLILMMAAMASASPLDSLLIRFGFGVSKPEVTRNFENKSLGTELELDIPCAPTLMLSMGSLMKLGNWGVGGQFGVDGEAFSVDGLDGTGFSVGHIDALGAYQILQIGRSSIWLQGAAGWAFPIWRHDEAEFADAEGGFRMAAATEFARGATRVQLGISCSSVSFERRNEHGAARNDWALTHVSMMLLWDWLAPGEH